MITFRDLKLPKELSKKKKLELYKCWIITPLNKDSATRMLDLNPALDRYGLTMQSAVELEINKYSDQINNFTNNDEILDFFKKIYFVIGKITLSSGSMDEEVIIPPLANNDNIDLDPHFDSDFNLLTATVHERMSNVEIKNYVIMDLQLEKDINTGIFHITKLDLQEQIINHSVTGK